MKIPKVYFNARQTAAIAALATAIGTALVVFGLMDEKQVAALLGLVVAGLGLWPAFQQAGANDTNTATTQAIIGVEQDSKISNVTIDAATDLARRAFEK